MTASWPDGMMKTRIYPVKGLLTLCGYPTLFLQCDQTGRTERSLFGISLCLTPAGLPRKNAPCVVVVTPNKRCARRIASLESQPEGTGSFVVRRIPATHPFGADAKILSRDIFASKDRTICLKSAFPRHDRSSPTGSWKNPHEKNGAIEYNALSLNPKPDRSSHGIHRQEWQS